MLPAKLAFVDIETTGMSALRGRIIEIGIVRVENGKVTQKYHQLINPQAYIPAEIEMLTGITLKDLENKPTFREIAGDILNILEDCVFVAHNVRFDYSFLKQEFLRQNITFNSKHFCTVKLSRLLYPQFTRHNLDAIIERFGFTCKNRHRAFDDAFIIWRFYKKAQKSFPGKSFTDAVNAALRRPSIPLLLKQHDLDSLPEQPGVYIFYGENGTPLYIGKSKNIKERVLSHFSGDIHSPREMNITRQIQSIETIITAGELGALFLEAQLIKKQLPIYNRLLRIKHELIALSQETSKDGYYQVKTTVINKIDPFNLDNFIGFFQSKKQAKNFLNNLASEFNLCGKLLGLEKTNTSCFGYRLDKCNGACVSKEPVIKYNFRFLTATVKSKIRRWPYHGPIIIKEKNDTSGFSEYFLIDKWCFLGSIREEHELNLVTNKLSGQTTQYNFDLDMYKILLRYLNKEKNRLSVKPIENEDFLTALQSRTNL